MTKSNKSGGKPSQRNENVDEETLEPMVGSHAYDNRSPDSVESMINQRKSGLLVCFFFFVILVALMPTRQSGHVDEVLFLQCPGNVTKAANDNDNHFQKDYLSSSSGKGNMALTSMNVSDFLDRLPKLDYDNWGHPYETVKEGLYHWKSTMYPDNVNEGDMIYESACGIGLNLYLTLEILKEVKGLESLTVFGNDYLEPSAERANTLFDYVSSTTAVKKGSICAADSTNLKHVPNNTFDLVFTGYITPIYDPINLGNGTTNEKYKFYRELCEGNDWKDQKLTQIAQSAQEAFYAMWVGEMIRIAKPGKAIIVEEVSHPYCDWYRDWGGVPKEWWKPAIDTYNWDVDPDSIMMEKDTIFSNRYHVFMRKNL